MKTGKSRNIWLLLILLLSGLFGTSCQQNHISQGIIITQAPINSTNSDPVAGDGSRYVKEAQIVLIDPEKPSSPEILTREFYSACAPEISWNAAIMVFAGQRKESDPWQIWMLDLKTREFKRLTDSEVNCTDPVSLPTGKIVFSKTEEKSNAAGSALYASNADGSESSRLTFHPHENFATSILADGRLISVTRQQYPKLTDPELIILRPDGTKADLFYRGKPGCVFLGRVRESDDGRIFFVESDTVLCKGNIISVNYNRPLYTSKNYTNQLEGSFQALFPIGKGKLWVSYRKSNEEPYSLYEFDADKKELGKKIFTSENMSVIDVVEVTQHTRPKKLPSELDMGVKTGLLLCQDINFTGLGIVNDEKGSREIEIVGIDSSMGIVNVEADGSVYLKVIANKPFQIRKLDKKGETISQSAWIWLRPNERRGCVGCHENPELAPENRVPLSIKKDPVSIPVHISKMLEKEVELE